MKKKTLVLTSLLSLAVAVTSAKADILIDFGVNNDPTVTVDAMGQTINNVATARVGDAVVADLMGLVGGGNLLNVDGSDSGLTFSAAQVGTGAIAIGGAAVDFTGTLPASPTGTFYDPAVFADSLFVNDNTDTMGTSDERYEITIGGLDSTLSYDFTFLSAFDAGGANGTVTVSLGAGSAPTSSATVTYDEGATNQAEFIQLLDVTPDASGNVTLQVFNDSNANGRINSLEIAASTAAPDCLLGDVNLSADVNFSDISPFIAALSAGGSTQCEADIDQSGAVDFLDIAPFIALLSGQ